METSVCTVTMAKERVFILIIKIFIIQRALFLLVESVCKPSCQLVAPDNAGRGRNKYIINQKQRLVAPSNYENSDSLKKWEQRQSS